MEDNIYDDLDNQCDLGAQITDLQARNNELQLHVTSLEEDIQKLCNRITEMQKVQDSLSKNISELFNTAKSELERKDRRIAELQSQIDDMVFRRNAQHNPGFKRKAIETKIEDTSKRMRQESVDVIPIDNSAINSSHSEHPEKSNTTSKERICESNIKNSHRNSEKESESTSRAHSSENTSRDRRDSRRDRRDNGQDNGRDWGNHRDSRTDRRDSRRDRDSCRDNWDNNRSYRDKSRGRNRDSRDYKGTYREYKDNRNREINNENSERKPSNYINDIREYENSRKRGDKSEDNQVDQLSKNKPVLSRRKSTTQPIARENVADSKEEGEITEEETTSVANQNEENIPKKRMDFGRNLPFDDKKNFNVNKYIEQQKSRNKIKNVNSDTGINEKREVNVSSTENTVETDDDKIKKEKLSSKEKVVKVDASDTEKKVTDNKSKRQNSVTNKKIETDHKSGAEEKEISKVNIISNIILLGGVKNIQTASASTSQSLEKKGTNSKQANSTDKPTTSAPKIEKKTRESRVPRNLTNDLNINLERSKSIEDRRMELLGSSEKKGDLKKLNYMSPSYVYGLTDDGEIPKLKLFSAPDTSEVRSNDTNPVTEFQIFKTNLPSLEKSNSLSSISVQIQTPNKEEKSETTNNMNSNRPVQKEVNIEQSSDICLNNSINNMLNMDLGQYRAEDFPNMSAPVESMQLTSVVGKMETTPKISVSDSDKKVTEPMDVNKNSVESKIADIQSINKSPEVLTVSDVTPSRKQTGKKVLKPSPVQDSSDPSSDLCDKDIDEFEKLMSSQPFVKVPLLTPIKDISPVSSNRIIREEKTQKNIVKKSKPPSRTSSNTQLNKKNSETVKRVDKKPISQLHTDDDTKSKKENISSKELVEIVIPIVEQSAEGICKSELDLSKEEKKSGSPNTNIHTNSTDIPTQIVPTKENVQKSEQEIKQKTNDTSVNIENDVTNISSDSAQIDTNSNVNKSAEEQKNPSDKKSSKRKKSKSSNTTVNKRRRIFSFKLI